MEKPIRILHVFGRLDRGGAETMIMNLYRNIDRSKIQFDFIIHTNEKCDYNDEIFSLGGKVYSIPRYTGKNHFIYKKVWKNFFKKHPEYKIIHGHMRSTAAIYLKIAKKNGLITIAHSHSTSSGTGLLSIIKNTLQYPIRYIANYRFSCSEAAGIWLFGKKGCRSENFYILNNAIDTKKFIFNETIRIKKRKEFQIEGKFVIGHIGRFHAAKNHEFLVEIFKMIHDKNKNTVLMLVGDGSNRQVIEKKVQDLGLIDSVIFAGVRSDIPELLQAMDVFVFPSLFEGLPVSVIEAQAAGLPCIISKQITPEVKVSDLVTSISLREPPEHWAKIVLSHSEGYDRGNIYSEIVKAGYDIKHTSKWLQKFYLENRKWKFNGRIQ
ncbi:glycosyltransferase family 1 protein [Fictibacillus gelatini]|uniref:glycosyltransferase family 1 protein n=1 Tax=Fictibacillus gelatini TaxID=225985 RepID=UPI0004296504|nr:glycosyltransferase family 1 protein [Fictibacillus gelatini]